MLSAPRVLVYAVVGGLLDYSLLAVYDVDALLSFLYAAATKVECDFLFLIYGFSMPVSSSVRLTMVPKLLQGSVLL